MNKQEFNKLIRDTYDTGISDPYRVAETVLATLTPDDYSTVLAIVLPSYTRVMGHKRNRSVSSFSQPVFVPSDGWKDMAQLTASECREVATEYRKRAEQNASLAEDFDSWAVQMESSEVVVLGDLLAYRSYMAMKTKEGMAKAKAAGRSMGRPIENPEVAARIIEMRKSGMKYQAIADSLNNEGTYNRSGFWTANAVAKQSYHEEKLDLVKARR